MKWLLFFFNCSIFTAVAQYMPHPLLERTSEGIRVGFDFSKGAFPIRVTKIYASNDTVNSTKTLESGSFYSVVRPALNSQMTHRFETQFSNGEWGHLMDIHETSELGLSVVIHSEPDSNYGRNGALQLVDGIFGSIPFNHDDWLVFRDEKVEWTLEMDRKEYVFSVCIGFLEDEAEHFVLPDKIEVYCSRNGRKWKLANTVYPEKQGVKINNLAIFTEKKTKFIRIITYRTPVVEEERICMDEIELIKKNE